MHTHWELHFDISYIHNKNDIKFCNCISLQELYYKKYIYVTLKRRLHLQEVK